MKKLLITAASVTVLSAAPVLAATPEFSAVDANGNGTISYEELVVMMPDTSKDQFASADADGSGELSIEEYEAATKS